MSHGTEGTLTIKDQRQLDMINLTLDIQYKIYDYFDTLEECNLPNNILCLERCFDELREYISEDAYKSFNKCFLYMDQQIKIAVKNEEYRKEIFTLYMKLIEDFCEYYKTRNN